MKMKRYIYFLGLTPHRPSLTPGLERLLGTVYIPEGRAAFDALVPDRYKVKDPPVVESDPCTTQRS